MLVGSRKSSGDCYILFYVYLLYQVKDCDHDNCVPNSVLNTCVMDVDNEILKNNLCTGVTEFYSW